MADRTVHPTPEWRWPEKEDLALHALVAKLHDESKQAVGRSQAERDRDELAAALEKAVAFHWEDVDHDPEPHQDYCRVLLARIKAGGG